MQPWVRKCLHKMKKNPVVNGVQLFDVIYSFKDLINAIYSGPEEMHTHTQTHGIFSKVSVDLHRLFH